MENKFAPAPWIYSPIKLKVHPVNDDRMTVCYFNSYESEPYTSERNSFGYLISAAPDLLEALQDIVARSNRAREILQNGPTGGNWGMLDTESATAAINKALNK